MSRTAWSGSSQPGPGLQAQARRRSSTNRVTKNKNKTPYGRSSQRLQVTNQQATSTFWAGSAGQTSNSSGLNYLFSHPSRPPPEYFTAPFRDIYCDTLEAQVSTGLEGSLGFSDEANLLNSSGGIDVDLVGSPASSDGPALLFGSFGSFGTFDTRPGQSNDPAQEFNDWVRWTPSVDDGDTVVEENPIFDLELTGEIFQLSRY